MANTLRSSLMIAAMAATIPVISHHEVHAIGRRCCCHRCRQPCGRCTCPAPAPVVPFIPAIPQTTYQPVIETQYAQQPVLQQRDVTAMEYRTEPVLETVPATTVENVTVDEGSYQTVWVPRLTTKAVARTTYQTRSAYRTVPYQVTRRISEYATQTVPFQTVRYVTAGTALTYAPTTGYVAGWPSVYAGGPIVAGTYPAITSAPVVSVPSIASRYDLPYTSPTTASTGLVPDARYADTPTTPILPRSASIDRSSDRRSASRGPSLFVPAPSAAQVWRSMNTATR